MKGDHPGMPATPGMNAAVARVIAGIEYGERQARLRVDAERRAHADRRLGDAARSLRGDRLDAFRRDFPELAQIVSGA